MHIWGREGRLSKMSVTLFWDFEITILSSLRPHLHEFSFGLFRINCWQSFPCRLASAFWQRFKCAKQSLKLYHQNFQNIYFSICFFMLLKFVFFFLLFWLVCKRYLAGVDCWIGRTMVHLHFILWVPLPLLLLTAGVTQRSFDFSRHVLMATAEIDHHRQDDSHWYGQLGFRICSSSFLGKHKKGFVWVNIFSIRDIMQNYSWEKQPQNMRLFGKVCKPSSS